MSIVIKGIKIPESCLDCPIYDHYNYHCNLYGYGIPARYNYDPSERPEWCELEGLPEHHGRIIDEDEIIVPSLSSWADQVIVADAIMDAPTIIEAE